VLYLLKFNYKTLINTKAFCYYMTTPWIVKYQPKKSDEIPQKYAITQLKKFLENHRKEKKKAAFIYGNAGSCKTCSVHALAKELDLELIEVNASDFRNTEQVNLKIGNAIKQASLFSKSKLILVDEVDGLAGNDDRGGISTLSGLIADSRFPIVMTANDPWDSKMSSLRTKSTMIEFGTMNYLSIYNILKELCTKESIKFDETALKSIARLAGGDLRAAINDVQSLAYSKKEIKQEHVELLGARDKIESMFNALLKILKTTDPALAVSAFDNVDEDLEKCLFWLDENMPKEYTKPEDLVNAYNELSKADVFLGRIRKQQYYRMLVYANTSMTAGVAMAKKEKANKFVKYSPTMRILKIWQGNQKFAKRKTITEKIAIKTHSSKRKTIQSTMPFLQQAFKQNQEFASKMSEELDLDEEEIEWLKK